MNKIFITLLTLIFTVSCMPVEKIPRVPEWSKNAVWYQIFPERFNNGDSTNDPSVSDVINIWPFIEPKGWQVHPWTSDWYKRQPWEAKLDYDFYQIQGLRRYGGDIQGIINKIGYLKDLGISAVYLNPVFESPSLHKYDASMYRHIDNNFGPDPEKDMQIWQNENPLDPSTWEWTTADSLFLLLIKECHNNDIKIIIDGVFNHVGIQHWAFKDVLENQENSAFSEWFTVTSWDNPATDENEFDYEGWIGIKDLPEFKENENGLIPPIKKHIFNIVKRWMDPNDDGDTSDGIDGWRLDVAEMVNISFWKEFRSLVKSINPDAYITGEIWWEDWNRNKMFNAAPWLQGDAFDAVMNYRFARGLRNFVLREDSILSSQSFIDTLNNIYHDYNSENMYALMNLMDSHDVDRLASQVVNPDRWYDHYTSAKDDRNYNVEAPDSIGRLKQKLVLALQMTLPGAPMIYYGDETGMWGGDDPDCRKPMVWDEYVYDIEKHHPYGFTRNPDPVEFDGAIYNWYKKLIRIRNLNEVLRTGEIDLRAISETVLYFRRFTDNNNIYIFANNSNKNSIIKLDQSSFDGNIFYTDLISGKQIQPQVNSAIELEAYQIIILK